MSDKAASSLTLVSASDTGDIVYIVQGGNSRGANVRHIGDALSALYQPLDAGLTDLSGLAPADGSIPIGDGGHWVAESGATARTSLGLGTGDTPQFTGVEIGHASDTTITRASAGDIAVEGNTVYRAGGTDVAVADGGHGASTAAGALVNLGIPYFPAANYGFAAGASAATNATAINSAVTAAAAAGGGVVLLPSGTFSVDPISAITANAIQIRGMGAFGGTTIVPTGTTGDTFAFSGCQHSGIADVYIRPTVRKSSGYAVSFSGGAYSCYAENVRADYCYNGFIVSGATETRIRNIQTRYILGFAGVLFSGSLATPSYRMVIDDYLGDNPYPQGYGTVKAYAGSTAFSLGDIVVSGNYVWQCTTAGTTGGSTPPTTPGGTTAQDAFDVAVTDGTAAWKMVCYSDSAHIVQENYAYSLVVNKAGCINLARGFRQIDSAATGTSYPIWAFITDIEIDHSYAEGVQLSNGEGCYINNSWVSSSLTSDGIVIGENYRGEVFIGGGTRIAYARLNGILLYSGPVDVIVSGCFIGDNSQTGSGSNHGIAVGAGASNFQFIGNRCGDIVGVAGNNQGYGILVNTGASDHYIISNNLVSGNVTGGVADAGTGANKSVTGNVT